MTIYIVPIIFLSVLILSLIFKQDAYAAFVKGAGSAIELMTGVLPFLLTVMIACEIFRTSGVSTAVSGFLSPALEIFGVPGELTELVILRPLSGAGSLSVLEHTYQTYGVDSYISKCASVIYGSSETVFYVSSIYFSKSNVKNLRFAIPVALLASFVGNIVGCALCRF